MLFTTTAAALLLVTGVHAISKISRSGRYLYDESGSRFYLKGIAYQEQGAVAEGDNNPFLEPSSFQDPLAQPEACARDLPKLQELGVNSLRIYSVNSSLNHDACMKTFSDAGIYTIIDLALPLNGSIDRTSPSWSTNILDQYTRTIDAFSSYGPAVLAFNVGNEVATKDATSPAPFVKAAARDIKAYLASKSSPVLVGYAAIDGPTGFRKAMAEFLTCDPSGGGSGSTAIDLYGFNNYAWCGDASFDTTYKSINEDFTNYNVPAYFSEYGCVVSGQTRPWTEVPVLFSDQMTSIWSGGVAFSYFPAASAAGQFGVVTLSTDLKTVTTSTDFDNLKSQYTKVSFINSPSSSSASTSYGTCPSATAEFAASSSLPATPDEASCNCVDSGLSCQFRPQTANSSTLTGELINLACSSLLPTKGGNCDDIGANGTTGTYGRLSGCSPGIKLGYLMSQWYELSSKDPQACSFSGNGTVNSAASAAPSAAAASCISNPAAVFTPSSAPDSSSTGGKTSASPAGSTKPNAAVATLGSLQPFLALGAVSAVGLLSALLTLA